MQLPFSLILAPLLDVFESPYPQRSTKPNELLGWGARMMGEKSWRVSLQRDRQLGPVEATTSLSPAVRTSLPTSHHATQHFLPISPNKLNQLTCNCFCSSHIIHMVLQLFHNAQWVPGGFFSLFDGSVWACLWRDPSARWPCDLSILPEECALYTEHHSPLGRWVQCSVHTAFMAFMAAQLKKKSIEKWVVQVSSECRQSCGEIK